MAKMTGGKAAKMGYKSKSTGNSDDGARKSQKGQTSGNLASNTSAGIRESRVKKMEARNVKC